MPKTAQNVLGTKHQDELSEETFCFSLGNAGLGSVKSMDHLLLDEAKSSLTFLIRVKIGLIYLFRHCLMWFCAAAGCFNKMLFPLVKVKVCFLVSHPTSIEQNGFYNSIKYLEPN